MCIVRRTCGLQQPPDEAPQLIEVVSASFLYIRVTPRHPQSLLGKAKLEREISDGKNKIPHKFLGRKI